MRYFLFFRVFFILVLLWGVSVHADPEFPPSLDFRYPQMPYLDVNPGPEYDDSVRMFQGIPSIARAQGGRLWAAWYGGGMGEGQDNYVMLATSGGDGQSWSKPVLVVNPPFRASEPAVWTDPDGKLWFMFNLYPIRRSGRDQKNMEQEFEDVRAYQEYIAKYNFVGAQLWVMTTENPDEANPTWSEPRLLAMETHNMNKPTVLVDGTWVWPAAPVSSVRGLMPRPLFSTDSGKTFVYRGVANLPPELVNAHEYQIVERKDGSLWLLNRVRGGIGESFSSDGGKTWTLMERSSIVHTVSRFYITRLQSGNLLLVKHGPVDQDVGRSQLMAFLSEDDGETWSGGLMIDERNGVSYPDGEQGADGLIRIIYDYNRHDDREILMAVFAEEDVAAGMPISSQAAFRQVVNQARGRRGGDQAVPQWMLDVAASANEDAQPLQKQPVGAFAAQGVESVLLESGAQLFADRPRPTHFAADIPADLKGAHFLRLPIDGTHAVKVTRSGMVYLLTPQPHRNPDSQSQALLDQGFSVVALSEFELLAAGGERHLVTLYQKEMREGDSIVIGKWAVPVFFP
ncbi:sialidase family protein [Coraliomargarita sp. W4R53]